MNKKLLILTRHPHSASFRQRVSLFFEALDKANIEYETEKIPSKIIDCVKLFKKAKKFSAVFLHKKRLNAIERFFFRQHAKKVIYDFDDAVMFDNLNPDKLDKKKYNKFTNTVKIVDTVIAGNRYLANIASKHNQNVKILPTGLDITKYTQKQSNQTENIKLVWIGSGSNLEYLKQISPTLEKIGQKYKNVLLKIICNEFIDLQNMKVEKIAWSLESQGKELADCDIGLGPLPENKFTLGKCGFKLLQYAATGITMVTSPVGVNAEIIQDGKNGFYATDTNQWTEKLSLLIENKTLRDKMALAALQTAKQYDVTVLKNKFIDIITETINK